MTMVICAIPAAVASAYGRARTAPHKRIVLTAAHFRDALELTRHNGAGLRIDRRVADAAHPIVHQRFDAEFVVGNLDLLAEHALAPVPIDEDERWSCQTLLPRRYDVERDSRRPAMK
jgi:hypothetical protein